MYIIFDKEEDVQKTRDLVGNRVHIFTKAEIMEDVIGVDHHEEILPSQFEIDCEAAQRHLARVSKIMHEKMEEKFGGKLKKS